MFIKIKWGGGQQLFKQTSKPNTSERRYNDLEGDSNG